MENQANTMDRPIPTLARFLLRFNVALSRSEIWLATGATITFIILTLIECAGRYVFNFSQAWIQEVATILFIWAVFLGAAVGFRSKAHLAVDLFTFDTESGLARARDLLVTAINILFAAAFVYLGIELLQKGFQRTTPVLSIPIFYCWMAPVVMAASSLFYLLEHLVIPGHVEDDIQPPSVV